MVWYGMVWYGMVWHDMVWNGMVWRCMAWSGMAWHEAWHDLVVGGERERGLLIRVCAFRRVG